jgi:hypothetical protein
MSFSAKGADPANCAEKRVEAWNRTGGKSMAAKGF